MYRENTIKEYYYNNKDHVLKMVLLSVHSLILLLPLFRIYGTDGNIFDVFTFDDSQMSFPLTFLFLSLLSICFYIYTIIKKSDFDRMNYFYSLVNNVVIVIFLIFTSYDNDMNTFPVLFFILLFLISTIINLYLFKFADSTVEEDFLLIFRRIVTYVYHFGYILMFGNYLVYIAMDGFSDILGYDFWSLQRLITSIIFIVSIFFIKRDKFRNRLFISLYLSFPVLWLLEVVISDDVGPILLELILFIVLSFPIVLVNYDLLNGNDHQNDVRVKGDYNES